MRIKLILGLTALLLSLCPDLLAQDGILGYWMDESRESIIEIYKVNGHYNGRIVWVKDPMDDFGQELRDVMNDNPRMRSRKVMGMDMLTDFRWSGEEWRKGEIYNYRTGNDYNGKIHINEDGELRLKGYYSLLFFLGRTKTWRRPADPSIYGLR